jgi:hypothetical protein
MRRERIDGEKLRSDLRFVITTNRRYFAMAAGLTIGLFVVLVVVILTNVERQEVLTGAVLAFGVSVAGCISWMVKIAMNKQTSEALLTLAAHLDEDALKTVITILARASYKDTVSKDK